MLGEGGGERGGGVNGFRNQTTEHVQIHDIMVAFQLIFRLLTVTVSSKELSQTEHCNENPIYVFPEKELRGLSPNFHIHESVSDLYIPRIGPHIFLLQNRQTNPNHGNIYIAHRHINVEIGTKAAQFLFWEYLLLNFWQFLCSVRRNRSHTIHNLQKLPYFFVTFSKPIAWIAFVLK